MAATASARARRSTSSGSAATASRAAALAVSLDLGLQREGVLRALRGFSGLKGRGEKLLSRSGIGILDDSYNASPDALKASLLVLSKEEGRRKIALLSDMLELGERSEELHEDCGAFLSSLPIDRVLLYGEKSLGILRGIRREEKLKDPLRAGDRLRCPENRSAHLGKSHGIFFRGGGASPGGGPRGSGPL